MQAVVVVTLSIYPLAKEGEPKTHVFAFDDDKIAAHLLNAQKSSTNL